MADVPFGVMIAVFGNDANHPGDRVTWAQSFEPGPGIAHGLHRESCEDIQAYTFLLDRLFMSRAVGSVWVETNHDDPPDRYLLWQDERLGLELTVLTIESVREAETHARWLREALLAVMRQNPESYAHLIG